MPPIFRKSIITSECDRCGRVFPLGQGGACTSCRAVLCNDHLHGGLLQQLRVNLFGGASICIQCRAKGRA